MNAERLHAILVALNQEMAKANIVTKMTQLIGSLQNVVAQPLPQHQQALSQTLKAMYEAVTDPPSDTFSPAWRQILHETGGEDLFGYRIKSRIEEIFSRNTLTPAVALEELKELQGNLTSFKNALDQGTSALKRLNISDEKLAHGECEIGVLIPRAAVTNQLLDFAEELTDVGFILNTLSEVATGKKDDLAIRTISSSDLLIYLQAGITFGACVAVCVERVVALYKQLLEIRKLRQDIRKQGVPDEDTTGIEKYANQLMQNGIEKIAVEIITEYHKSSDHGRKNELTNAVRISLNKIANKIDHGFNLEVRVAPVPQEAEEEGENEALRRGIIAIQSATSNMQFLKLEGQPILSLPEGKEKRKSVFQPKRSQIPPDAQVQSTKGSDLPIGIDDPESESWNDPSQPGAPHASEKGKPGRKEKKSEKKGQA